MVSSVASLKHLSAGRWPVASVRPQTTSQSETTQTGTTTEQARTGRGGEGRARRVDGAPGTAELSSAAMTVLLGVQERHGAHEARDRATDALGDVLDRLERKKPKPPEPNDPPPPPPAEPPPPAPRPVVVDDPAPARYLASVLERLHAEPVSQFPDVPFSQRNAPKTSPQPAAPAGLGAFYTPGVFTQAQAGAMRTVSQGQAGLALLQAAQMQAYGAAARPNAFRINTFA